MSNVPDTDKNEKHCKTILDFGEALKKTTRVATKQRAT